MRTQQSLGCLLVLGGLAASGCAAPADEQVGVAEEEIVTLNALTLNALTLNALTLNALTLNALTLNGLTSDALNSNADILSALQDPNAQELLKYVVSCALPEGALVSTPSGDYEGSLGLAPEWGESNGHCDKSCQEWVSACVISRVDALGQEVEISIRGQNNALTSSPSELAQYTHREGSYYGSIFSQPQRLYVCLPPGATSDPRVCGSSSMETCGITYTGSCADVCEKPTEDGAYRNCRAPGANDKNQTYHGSITVYLQQ